MSILTESRSYSYSVFTFVTDEIRSTSVPIGIAIWGSRPEHVRIKLTTGDDRVKGMKPQGYAYISLVKLQMEQWIKDQRLPYATGSVTPDSDEWWRHVSKLLVHRIRLSEPRPIDCSDAEEELDLLYEAVVGPQRGLKDRTARIDRVINASLGPIARRLDRGCVAGFMGRPVPVKGFKASGDRLVVIEGVNLAATDAEDDTDALVSRLQRIRESGTAQVQPGRSVIAYVGYLASPNGLNGESALVEWINAKAGAKTFDLIRERERFADHVEQEISSLERTSRRDPLLY